MIKPSDLRIPFTWEERRPVFLGPCFYIPGAYDHGTWNAIPWREFFGNDLPVIIEYCSGNGQWIGERALNNPGFNWVAVEKRFDRASKIWAKIHRESIPNLFVVCSEALAFTKFYVLPESVAGVFVNFPDPWPKLRHAKHRLVTAKFLDELLRVMVSHGRITCATDDQVYASSMVEEFEKCPGWRAIEADYKLRDYGGSYFSDLWVLRGRSIHFLSYEKIQ